MKKLALAIAISAAATAAQAQIVAQSFSGSLNFLSTASGFSGGGVFSPADVQNSLLSYTVDLVYNAGTQSVVSMDVTLDGSFGTTGSGTVPPFAQQTWTLTNAVYSIDTADFTTAVTNFAPDFSSLTGSFAVNGGALAALPGSSASSLTSGSAVCGGGSCGSFDPNGLLSALNLDFVLNPNAGFAVVDSSFAVAFVSTSGNTGYAMTSAIPVPAAAWLFGSALVGLAGIGRKRKMA